MATTLTTSDRLRAVCKAMTDNERFRRFQELKQVAADQGGILLDPDQTLELVALGDLLGVEVIVERVELYTPPKGAAVEEPAQVKGKDRWTPHKQQALISPGA